MPFFRIMHLAVSSISLVFDQISCGAFVLCGACMFASVFVCCVRLSFRSLTAQKEDKQYEHINRGTSKGRSGHTPLPRSKTLSVITLLHCYNCIKSLLHTKSIQWSSAELAVVLNKCSKSARMLKDAAR